MDLIDELIDRFGDPPDAVKGLMDVALVRNTAAQFGIKEITQRGQPPLLPEALDMERTIASPRHAGPGDGQRRAEALLHRPPPEKPDPPGGDPEEVISVIEAGEGPRPSP